MDPEVTSEPQKTTSIPSVEQPSYPESFDVQENISERSELKQENSKLDNKIKLTDKQIKDKKAEVTALQKEISELSVSIKNTNDKIDGLNQEINRYQRLLDEKTEEIDDILSLLRIRLRKLHTSGDVSSLELILGAKSFSDLIDKTEMVKSMSQYDSDIINSAKGQMKEIAGYKRILQSQKEDVENEKLRLETDKKKINELLDKNTKLINELTTEKEKLEIEKKENEAKQKELKKALEAYRKWQAEHSGGQIIVNPPSDGSYVWPCPGFTYLTSTFDEWRGSNNHGAIDIAEGGIYGAKVVACNDGYVFSTYSGCDHDYGKFSSCGCGGGYGNYVMIDHGGGKISVYGHLSGVTVTAGQTVSAGQLIGYVGSTGYSTGPHLHFETRFNGVRYDPLKEY